MVRWSFQSVMVGHLARQRRQPAVEEIAKALAARVDVAAVAIDEVHRHVERIVDVALEAHAVLEHERQHAAAIGIGVGPDVAAIAEEAVRPALGERRVGEHRRGQRLQRQADPELPHHVGLGGEVEIDLDGAAAQHHVEAEIALLGHVVAHDAIAALGHPGDVVAPPFGLEAEPEHADAERLGDRAHLVEMLVHLRAGLVQGLDRRARQLELAARLEGDAGAALLQGDRAVLLADGAPAEARRQALQQRAHAALALVGERPQIAVGVAELLVLGADPPVGLGLAAGLENATSWRRSVIGSPWASGGADMGASGRRCDGARSAPVHDRQIVP